MKSYYPISIITLIVGLPIVLCLAFKYFPLGSIGPFVPITGVINVFSLPIILYLSFKPYCKNTIWKIILIITAVAFGLILAVIGMNIFIWLTGIFGIMDYQLM